MSWGTFESNCTAGARALWQQTSVTVSFEGMGVIQLPGIGLGDIARVWDLCEGLINNNDSKGQTKSIIGENDTQAGEEESKQLPCVVPEPFDMLSARSVVQYTDVFRHSRDDPQTIRAKFAESYHDITSILISGKTKRRRPTFPIIVLMAIGCSEPRCSILKQFLEHLRRYACIMTRHFWVLASALI